MMTLRAVGLVVLMSVGLAVGHVALAAPQDLATAAELRNPSDLDAAAELYISQSDMLDGVESSMLVHQLPALSLLDGRWLPVSSPMAWIGATELPMVPLDYVTPVGFRMPAVAARSAAEAREGMMNASGAPIQVGGEAGVYYGVSTGKHGREDFGTYLVGTVGNDKTAVTVGASYEESNGRGWGRSHLLTPRP